MRHTDEKVFLTNGEPKTKYVYSHPPKKTDFDELYEYKEPDKPAFCNKFLQKKKCDPKNTILSLFPVLKWLPQYKWKSYLIHDIISGFTVAIMHIPQGMAYALLGGVPPVVGIYMAFFPVLIYFLMGTSRHISMGTFAVVCMMTSKSVILYSSNEKVFNSSVLAENKSLPDNDFGINNQSNVYTPVQVATTVCFVVGVWQLILGVCHLGVLSVLLSETLVSGFTTGAAVHVLTSQVKNILGIKTYPYSGPLKIIYTYVDIFQNISTANPAALVISAVSIFSLAVYNELIKPRIAKKLPLPLPIELVAVIVGTLVSTYGKLNETYKVQIVGEIPTGFPVPVPPPFELIIKVIVDGLIIAIVAFSVNMSMASIFSRKHNYSIDANQELVASGCSNIFGAFFSCIPFAASLSRSLIQESVGGVTQLASVVSCFLLLLVLLVIGPFFEPLPNSVLASIVVVALKGMFMQVKDVLPAWRLSPFDGFVWIITFLSVVLLDIDYGLGIGIFFSLLCILIMGQKPSITVLGHVPSTDLYLDLSRYQACTDVPGISIIQVSGGLHFANKEYVRHQIYKFLQNIPEVCTKKCNSVATLRDSEVPHSSEHTQLTVNKDKTNCVILDMMAISFIDPSAMRMILSIYNDLNDRGVLFCLVNCPVLVYEKLFHRGFFNEFSESHLFLTVHDAVQFAQDEFKKKQDC